MIPNIPGISTGGGGLSYSGGTQASEASGGNLTNGGHVFNFGEPPAAGVDGINFNQLALYGFAALVLVVAFKQR